MISVTCLNCSYKFEAPTEAVAKNVKCSQCGHSFVLSLPPQAEPELVLYPIAEPTPLQWSPVKVGAWIVLVFLALVVLVAIAAFVQWTAYPNQKQDEERYKRMSQRIESERAKSARDR